MPPAISDEMTDAEAFQDWRQRLFPAPHSMAKAARALGRHPDGLRKIERGERPLDQVMRLAMTALAHGLRPYAAPPPP